MATIYAALLGATAAAVTQFVVSGRRLHLRRDSARRAIAAEVAVLAELVRIQYRPDHLREFSSSIAADPQTTVFPPDPSLGFFTVYEGLSGQLGMFDADHAATIVEFYTFYKVAIMLASPADSSTSIDDATIDLLLLLSDRIIRYKASTPVPVGERRRP